jgi:MFS family permease
MAPQVLATFRVIFPASERGKAFGIYGAMLGFASAVGLLLGAALTEANLFGWSWRSVFFVNVPVAVAALIAGLRFIPETRDPAARRPDVPGAVLLAGSLVAIVYPLLEGRQLGWPGWVWPLLAAGLAGLGVLGCSRRGGPGGATVGPHRCCGRGCCGSRRSRPGSVCSWRSPPACRDSSWPSRCGCRPASISRR